MASNWLSVDSNFPTFTGKESPQEQIAKLVDYMVQLTTQLRYSLQNLGTDNWNAKDLEKFASSATADVVKQMKQVSDQLTGIKNTVNNLAARVNEISGVVSRVKDVENTITLIEADTEDHKERIKALEESVAYLEQVPEDHEERLQGAEENIETAQADIDELQDRTRSVEETVQKLSGAVLVEDAGTTVGGEGKTVHLVGNIYINGVLYEGETT